MTESLADGPDWHLRSESRSGLPLFFFHSQSRKKVKQRRGTMSRLSHMAIPITSTVGSPTFEERFSEGPRSRASQNHAPLPDPCQLGTGPESERLLTRLCARELPEERLRLWGPLASHFTSENDQPGPPVGRKVQGTLVSLWTWSVHRLACHWNRWHSKLLNDLLNSDVGISLFQISRLNLNLIGLLEEQQFAKRIPHVALKIVVNTRYGRRGWRESVNHLFGKQEYRGKRLRPKDTQDHTSREINAQRHGGPEEENQLLHLYWWNDVASVRMCCNRSKTSLMLSQPTKH